MVGASQVFGRASGRSQWYNVTNGSIPFASSASIKQHIKEERKGEEKRREEKRRDT